MATKLEIKNLKEFIKKLEKTSNRILNNVERGLVKGGQFLQGESQDICPVMTGFLRASAFTRKVSRNHVVVGYSAAYAAFVHEKHASVKRGGETHFYFRAQEPVALLGGKECTGRIAF